MQTIDRDTDVISGAQDLEHLHTFLNFPVFMGCSDAPLAQDVLADMRFWISRGSGMIQLHPLLPLDVLYPQAHGAGCVGALWARHHQALADFIARHDPASVLEIGGAHGILATNYQAHKKIPWTILEPNPTPVAHCEARFIKGFFDANFRLDTPVDAVVHSHVFEHIYDPNAFVHSLADFLPPGKKLLFSVPNMRVMLERKYTNCLNFEHTTYLSEDYIENLLNRHGFRVQERSYFLEDHSIFYCAVRDPQVLATALASTQYTVNRALYCNYIDYHLQLVAELNQRMRAAPEARIYLFGAHVFAQYLLAFGLDSSQLMGLLDNDPNKQGRRLSGTHLQVFSPQVLRGLDRPIVILKAGVYNQEIKSDILENIHPGVVFLE